MADDEDQKAIDRAVIAMMRAVVLEPGQMLLFGPDLVAMVSRRRHEFDGALPDAHVISIVDWNPDGSARGWDHVRRPRPEPVRPQKATRK